MLPSQGECVSHAVSRYDSVFEYWLTLLKNLNMDRYYHTLIVKFLKCDTWHFYINKYFAIPKAQCLVTSDPVPFGNKM